MILRYWYKGRERYGPRYRRKNRCVYLETNLLLCGCFPIVVKSTMAGKIMGINRFLDTNPHPHRSTSCVVNAAGLWDSELFVENQQGKGWVFTGFGETTSGIQNFKNSRTARGQFLSFKNITFSVHSLTICSKTECFRNLDYVPLWLIDLDAKIIDWDTTFLDFLLTESLSGQTDDTFLCQN